MPRKIAIVGASPSAGDAPYTNPSWEVWALPWRNRTRGIVRYFDIHDQSDWTPDYLGFLRGCGIPVYMADRHPAVPLSARYPLAEVIASIGRDYFASSIAYMTALAIHEGADVIGLWGVDMAATDEYRQQRPNMDWLIGLAEGRGIRVMTPPGCPLASCPARYPNL